MHRGYRYRLYPTPDQEKQLLRFAGVCRFVYNLALEHRDKMWTYYRDNGVSLNFFQQSRELTQLRTEVDWIGDVPRGCQEAALHDLDRAFDLFFSGASGYPKYRRRGEKDSIRFGGRDCQSRPISARWSEVRLPKVGWLRYRDTRPLPGKIQSVTFTLDALGWHVAFAVEIEEAEHAAPSGIVGIDRGVANTVALSSGELLSLPDLNLLARKEKQARRVLSRRMRGSHRREKARDRLRRISAKIARVRLDWHHKTTTRIARANGIVVIEGLRIANMTASGRGKRGINRSITHQAWGTFERLLTYKVEERGGRVIKVNPAYTSQACSCCGVIDKASRESQAVFLCRHCGFAAHADTNAAMNILRRHTAGMEEGHHFKPSDEVRTVVAARAA
jgi:putative transposase